MFPSERERDGNSFHALRFPRWKWIFIKPLCEFFSRPSLPCLPSRAAHAYLLAASLHGGQCLIVLGSNYVTLIALLLYFGFQRCLWILCTSVIDESDSLRRTSNFLGQKELLQQLGVSDIAIVKSMLVWTLAFESRTIWDLQESLRGTVPLMKN